LRTLADDAASRAGAILNAALAVLAEHGYDAANMNDIAARAGVGKAAIGTAQSARQASGASPSSCLPARTVGVV
jgi:hypothetical protein